MTSAFVGFISYLPSLFLPSELQPSIDLADGGQADLRDPRMNRFITSQQKSASV